MKTFFTHEPDFAKKTFRIVSKNEHGNRYMLLLTFKGSLKKAF